MSCTTAGMVAALRPGVSVVDSNGRVPQPYPGGYYNPGAPQPPVYNRPPQ